jgi:hypothetical protein
MYSLSEQLRYRYDMIGAAKAGRNEHPQLVIQEYAPDAYYFQPEPIGDCWLFIANRIANLPNFIEEVPMERRAPVQAEKRWPAGTVAWSEHLDAWEMYARRYGSEQSAERIAERQGFGYLEMTDLLGRRPRSWQKR